MGWEVMGGDGRDGMGWDGIGSDGWEGCDGRRREVMGGDGVGRDAWRWVGAPAREIGCSGTYAEEDVCVREDLSGEDMTCVGCAGCAHACV